MTRIAECGFWKSPITSDLVAGESVRLIEPRIQGGSVYWLEGRPAERGRSVLVRQGPGGVVQEELPPPWSPRTRVHEYGGGAYTVCDGVVCFSEKRDGRLYKAASGGHPEALTSEGLLRYADLELDRRRHRLLAVCEDHSDTGCEAVQSIVTVDLGGTGNSTRTILIGSDFYSNPRLSPDGSSMCWLEWRHPNMPWDGTELWVGEVSEDGGVCAKRKVAGGSRESIFQPQWSPHGTLHFVSDRTGFWNLYREDGGRIVPLQQRNAEFGLPQWQFGMSTYGFSDDGRILCAYCEGGAWNLGLFYRDGGFKEIETPYSQIDGVAVRGQQAVFRAASPNALPTLVRLDLASNETDVLQRSAKLPNDLQGYVSLARQVSFPSTDGQTVHGFHYAPRNPDFAQPEDEKPPMIIRLHGGPTAAASNALSLSAQFWTSRGFSVFDLNYGGSTGYGRAYRERLNGQWGVVDVEDTVAAARYLVSRGMADSDRVIVKGGSAGGYTVLCCLAFRDEFAAGAAYYGISELKSLALDTHKFESRYLEALVGPWPDEEALYAERSPLGAADRLDAPAIFFQGSEDAVVPKEQTEAMVKALRKRRVPVAYYLFEGEAHGFRDGANVKRALDSELAFYGTMLLHKGLRF